MVHSGVLYMFEQRRAP